MNKAKMERWRTATKDRFPGVAVIGYKVSGILCQSPEDIGNNGDYLPLGSRRLPKKFATLAAARRYAVKHGPGLFVRSYTQWSYFDTKAQADAYEAASLPDVDETPAYETYRAVSNA